MTSAKKRTYELDPDFDDPIVSELHGIRHAMLADYGNDFEAMMRAICSKRLPGMRYVDPRTGVEVDPISFKPKALRRRCPSRRRKEVPCAV